MGRWRHRKAQGGQEAAPRGPGEAAQWYRAMARSTRASATSFLSRERGQREGDELDLCLVDRFTYRSVTVATHTCQAPSRVPQCVWGYVTCVGCTGRMQQRAGRSRDRLADLVCSLIACSIWEDVKCNRREARGGQEAAPIGSSGARRWSRVTVSSEDASETCRVASYGRRHAHIAQ